MAARSGPQGLMSTSFIGLRDQMVGASHVRGAGPGGSVEGKRCKAWQFTSTTTVLLSIAMKRTQGRGSETHGALQVHPGKPGGSSHPLPTHPPAIRRLPTSSGEGRLRALARCCETMFPRQAASVYRETTGLGLVRPELSLENLWGRTADQVKPHLSTR